MRRRVRGRSRKLETPPRSESPEATDRERSGEEHNTSTLSGRSALGHPSAPPDDAASRDAAERIWAGAAGIMPASEGRLLREQKARVRHSRTRAVSATLHSARKSRARATTGFHRTRVR